jgi:sulfur-oxidizing protein SoxY
MLKSRRKFIKALLSISVYGLTMAGSILQSTMAQTPWLKENFSAGSFDQTMRRLFGAGDIIDSNKIKISRLPRVAENGASVPITISSTLEHVEKISILVEQNSSPLSAEFFLSPALAVHVSARLKMAKTSNVVIIVQSAGKYYRTSRLVKVTTGGCGA